MERIRYIENGVLDNLLLVVENVSLQLMNSETDAGKQSIVLMIRQELFVIFQMENARTIKNRS